MAQILDVFFPSKLYGPTPQEAQQRDNIWSQNSCEIVKFMNMVKSYGLRSQISILLNLIDICWAPKSHLSVFTNIQKFATFRIIPKIDKIVAMESSGDFVTAPKYYWSCCFVCRKVSSQSAPLKRCSRCHCMFYCSKVRNLSVLTFVVIIQNRVQEGINWIIVVIQRYHIFFFIGACCYNFLSL